MNALNEPSTALNEPSTDAERINTKLKKGKSIAKGSFFAFLINKFMRSTNVVNADDSDTVDELFSLGSAPSTELAILEL